MKKFFSLPLTAVFLLTGCVFLLTGCVDDDGNPTHVVDIPAYPSQTPTEFLGNRDKPIDTWTVDAGDNKITYYHTRFRDRSEIFLFDCISTKEWGLTGGAEFTNLKTGNNSAVTTEGIRGYSYITYYHNPDLPVEPRISFRENGNPGNSHFYKVKGLYITNSFYAYNAMLNGDSSAKKFESGDWFKLTVYNNDKSKKVETLLAEGTNLLSKWKWINLTSLGQTDGLRFELSSSDTGSHGMNTPSCFCLDGIILEEE